MGSRVDRCKRVVRALGDTVLSQAWALLRDDACVLCGAASDDLTRLCAGCRASLWGVSEGPEGLPPAGVERHFSAFDYAWPQAQVVTRWKRRLDPRLGVALGAWLGERVGDAVFDALVAAGAARVDLVPVPLHATRQARRGGNQAGVLCSALARALRARADAAAPRPSRSGSAVEVGRVALAVVERHRRLVRCRATPQQRGLARRERLRSPRGAFALVEDGVAEAGDVTLLVDDVLTTGATLAAAAAPLIGSGHRVWTVSLLRAGR